MSSDAVPKTPGARLSTKPRQIIGGPEDPRYHDLRNFPEPRPGQNWVDARREQVAAIAARVAQQRRLARPRETIPYQIIARPFGDSSGADEVTAATAPDERLCPITSGLRQSRARPLVDDFAELIPVRPFCADHLSDGLQIRIRKYALEKRHIQLNGPAVFRWMIHDVDRADAYFVHTDAVVAQPTFIAINRDNGHAHAATLLAVPVARHRSARLEPLRYFAAVELGYSRRIGADRHYAGLIAKNPLHPHWRVEWRAERAATLDELSSWLRFEDMIPETTHDAMTGAGRNVMVFDELRAFGYREVLRFKRDGKSAEQFRARLDEVASGINGQFPRTLPASEVRSIAKSVAKWTWQRFSLERFSAIQRFRIQERWAGHAAVEVSRPWCADGISRATWYRRKCNQ